VIQGRRYIKTKGNPGIQVPKKKKKKKNSRWSLHYSLLCVSRECQGKIKDKIPKKQINITL
jgi:hypothetical protein